MDAVDVGIVGAFAVLITGSVFVSWKGRPSVRWSESGDETAWDRAWDLYRVMQVTAPRDALLKARADLQRVEDALSSDQRALARGLLDRFVDEYGKYEP